MTNIDGVLIVTRKDLNPHIEGLSKENITYIDIKGSILQFQRAQYVLFYDETDRSLTVLKARRRVI